uniref:Uncharacterized protein n=1 Tax=Oryza meridionalis TaxID=40149 RepID=A0A0E0CMS6_9ORYZ
MASTAMCGRRRRSGPARAGAAALAAEVEAGKGAAAVAAEVEPWRRGRRGGGRGGGAVEAGSSTVELDSEPRPALVPHPPFLRVGRVVVVVGRLVWASRPALLGRRPLGRGGRGGGGGVYGAVSQPAAKRPRAGGRHGASEAGSDLALACGVVVVFILRSELPGDEAAHHPEALGVAATRLLITLSAHMGHTIAERLCKTQGQRGAPACRRGLVMRANASEGGVRGAEGRAAAGGGRGRRHPRGARQRVAFTVVTRVAASMAPTSSSTPAGSRALGAEGVFECKTCNKSFPSL